VDPIRLATCLDRSVAASGAIAWMVSPCLPWRKLLSPAERSALRWSSGPGVRRLIVFSEISSLACGIDRLAALTPGRRPGDPLSDECATVALHAFGEGALAGVEQRRDRFAIVETREGLGEFGRMAPGASE
jgi:hypothetical protein